MFSIQYSIFNVLCSIFNILVKLLIQQKKMALLAPRYFAKGSLWNREIKSILKSRCFFSQTASAIWRTWPAVIINWSKAIRRTTMSEWVRILKFRGKCSSLQRLQRTRWFNVANFRGRVSRSIHISLVVMQ